MPRDTWKKQPALVNGTFIPLLVALLVVLVIAPFAESWPLASALLVSFVLIAGVFAVHENPLLRRGVVAAIIFALALRWTAHVYGEEHGILVIMAHLAIGMAMLLLIAICLDAVLRRRQITRDTVLGALCGYLLIAYVFAFGYSVLEDIKPGSFRSIGATPQHNLATKIGQETPQLLYYSFVTLTTVGYGDIVPANQAARSLATLEMLAGPLYLAAFVARLVGIMGKEVKRSDS